MSKYIDSLSEKIMDRPIELIVGLVVSIGAFGTAAPLIIESIGSMAGVEHFNALRLFSFIYFLIPVFAITTLWAYRLVYRERYISQPPSSHHFCCFS